MAAISQAEPSERPTVESDAAIAPPQDRRDHAVQAVAELGRRSLPGTAFHVAGLLFVELRLPGADQLPRALVVTLFSGCLIARLVGYYMTSRSLGSIRQRLVVLGVGAIGANVVWGVRTAAVHLHTGGSEQSMVMAIIMCGLSTGAMTAFAPSLWMQRGAQAALFVPILALGVAGMSPGSLAVLHALFFVYILGQGRVAHRTYWQSVHDTELLRRNAASAELAKVAADATNLQLRDEIAHRAQMEVELRQAQKLEAIGRLAAGVAHEINTPVQFISDSCRFLGDGIEQLAEALDGQRRIVTELAGGRLAAADALAEVSAIDDRCDLAYLRDKLPGAAALALEGLERVARIVGATKEFAYPHIKEKSLADLNKAIENTLILSNNETKFVADVETELGELPLIMCHGGELNQVILNIIVNAAHAIRDVVKDTGARGVIRVKTWSDPGWVRIAIADTGTGMPVEILDKIFEPFFTTKPVGMGTGQGLAIARSAIVDKHGGTIDVSSKVGTGTTFTIGLPLP